MNNMTNNAETNKDNNDNDNNDNNRTTLNPATANYSATRTSTTDTTNNTFWGMNATAWTWLIIGLAAIAIVALVWYYSMQITSSDYKDRD